jgi:two-component system, NtrC family, sensor kinase
VANLRTAALASVPALSSTESEDVEAIADSRRITATTTLAAGVSHELTNPLASLRSNLEVLQQQLQTAAAALGRERHAELNATIVEALQGADRMNGVIDSVRLFADGHRAAVGPTSMNQLAEAAIQMAWPLVGRRARIEQKLSPIPQVIANGSRLANVILKLLVIAADSIPEGAPQEHSITVATWFDEEANEVVLEVADTGVGMSPETAARAFDLPLQAQTGMNVFGLPLAYRLMTSMGGGMTIASSRRFGTRVQVMLAPVSAMVRPA